MGKNVDKNNSIEMILGDKVIIAGIDPVLNPSTRNDAVGRSKKETAITGSMGDVAIETATSTQQQCDNASDMPGGMLNLVGMNGVKIEAGSGGISLTSAGNINLMPGGGLCNIAATESLSCVSKNVNIASTGATNIAGGSLSVESQASSFANNVAMQGNTKISGGCFINGEAFIPHMTTQKQENYTSDSGECAGFLNPLQTFILMPGDKTLVEAAVPGNYEALYLPLEINAKSLLAALRKLINITEPGWIEPEVGVSIPIYAKPLLTHIVSKGMLNQLTPIVPSLKVALVQEHPKLASLFDLVDSEPDFNVFGHRHKFIGPACSYCDSTSDLYKEAQAVEGKELVKHKPCEVDGGGGAFKERIEEDKEAISNWFKAWMKRIAKNIGKAVFGP